MCSELWPDMIANGSFAACMRVLDSGIPERGVFEWLDASTYRPVGYDWRAVRLGTDYLVWVLRDDTERLRALDEARKARQRADTANQARIEFLSRISHELRTPLNAILGFTQLLELDHLSEDADRSLEQIHHAGSHLLELINDVLDIARIEAGRMDLAAESVSIRGVVTTVFELLQPEADRRDVALAIVSPGDVVVRADRQRLTQLVLHLVSNAVKYNRQGGSVTASWEVSGGTVSLSITDTGIGIAPDQLELAFVPFERLGVEQLGIDGTGVGLTLSRALAERMGGILTAISERESGSTFTVELPRAEPDQR
jgi:signal transduction histidine kinase